MTVDSLPGKTKKWLERIAPYNRRDLVPNSEGTALLVVDMQNFFLDENSPAFTCGGQVILPNVGRLIDVFRQANRPVIYTKHVHHPDRIDAGIMEWWWKGMCIEGSTESEIYPEISPLPHEKVVLKHRYSAFYNTDLETVTRCLKVEDLIITGVMTNLCCESTARDAYFRDYRVFFTADGTGASNEEMHLASLINLAYGFACVTTVSDIIKVFRA